MGSQFAAGAGLDPLDPTPDPPKLPPRLKSRDGYVRPLKESQKIVPDVVPQFPG